MEGGVDPRRAMLAPVLPMFGVFALCKTIQPRTVLGTLLQIQLMACCSNVLVVCGPATPEKEKEGIGGHQESLGAVR